MTRIDHFRAFVAYWAIPARNKTARQGTWHRAPGRELFDAVRRDLGTLPLIAEDLGLITKPVEHLRDDLRLPGMVVLQFAFSENLNCLIGPRGSGKSTVIEALRYVLGRNALEHGKPALGPTITAAVNVRPIS